MTQGAANVAMVIPVQVGTPMSVPLQEAGAGEVVGQASESVAQGGRR